MACRMDRPAPARLSARFADRFFWKELAEARARTWDFEPFQGACEPCRDRSFRRRFLLPTLSVGSRSSKEGRGGAESTCRLALLRKGARRVGVARSVEWHDVHRVRASPEPRGTGCLARPSTRLPYSRSAYANGCLSPHLHGEIHGVPGGHALSASLCGGLEPRRAFAPDASVDWRLRRLHLIAICSAVILARPCPLVPLGFAAGRCVGKLGVRVKAYHRSDQSISPGKLAASALGDAVAAMFPGRSCVAILSHRVSFLAARMSLST